MAEPSWIIYYSDGSTFSSLDGSWEDAPGWGCQVVLFRDPIVKYGIRHQGDFYRLDPDGTVVAMDMVSFLDHVMRVLGVVKAGSMLSQGEFDKVYQRAVEDRLKLQTGD